jgi:DNA repair protein RadC
LLLSGEKFLFFEMRGGTFVKYVGKNMSYYSKPIREWVAEDRPREKLMDRGVNALTDAELLAMVLRTGTQKLSAIALARQLIEHFGGLTNLSHASVAELMQVHGIGKAKASSLAAAFEISRRKLTNEENLSKFRHSGDIAKYLAPKVGDLRYEVFYVVSLDRKNNVIGETEIHRGGISSVHVDARVIFKEAMSKLASSIVLCHNHPGGGVEPSKADDELTEYLVQVAKVVDIPIVDHIIIARRKWYSYADQGRLRLMELRAEGRKEDQRNFRGYRPRMASS